LNHATSSRSTVSADFAPRSPSSSIPGRYAAATDVTPPAHAAPAGRRPAGGRELLGADGGRWESRKRPARVPDRDCTLVDDRGNPMAGQSSPNRTSEQLRGPASPDHHAKYCCEASNEIGNETGSRRPARWTDRRVRAGRARVETPLDIRAAAPCVPLPPIDDARSRTRAYRLVFASPRSSEG
jgi:hypothetical protein